MGKSDHQENYIPEIIEAENSDGEQCWYFALIKEEKHSLYEQARDNGEVNIKQNDEGQLFVCVNNEKFGSIIDNGLGQPTDEQKEQFTSEYGIPVHHNDTEDEELKTDDDIDASNQEINNVNKNNIKNLDHKL